MKDIKVAVLGCGPAGLMAAHGAVAAGATQIIILSKRRKSEMFGAQYLHEPIPGVPDIGSFTVVYKLIGTNDDYRRKVYGNNWSGAVSPESLEGQHQAWDIRRTYDWLWLRYQDGIADYALDPLSLDDALKEINADVVINTVPRPALCRMGHQFQGSLVWAAGDAPERGITLPYNQARRNQVLCNGEPEPAWYRLSNIDGYRTVEWPRDARPPIQAAELMKPTMTNCDCNPTLVHAGRYGRWDKSVLSHTAYHDAHNAVLEAMAAWA